MRHYVDLILLIKCETTEVSSWQHLPNSLELKTFFSLHYFMILFSFISRGVEVAPSPAFQSEGGNVFAEGRASAAKKKIKKCSTPPFTRHSVGDSIKSLTCDLFSEKQTARRVSEDQSHQRRAARV